MLDVGVDVKKVDVLVAVVAIHGFQTGNISQEGRSRETAEHKYRVLPA